MGRGWTRIKVAVMLNGLWIYCFNAGCTMTSLCEQEWQSIFSFLSSCLFSALLRCEWEVLHSNRATNKVKHVYRMCRYTCAQHYGYLQLFYANIYCFYCLSIFVKKNSVSFNFVVGMFLWKIVERIYTFYRQGQQAVYMTIEFNCYWTEYSQKYQFGNHCDCCDKNKHSHLIQCKVIIPSMEIKHFGINGMQSHPATVCCTVHKFNRNPPAQPPVITRKSIYFPWTDKRYFTKYAGIHYNIHKLN